MTVLILYYAIFVPMRVGFDIAPFSPALEVVFNLFFITDIALNFCTAIRVKGFLVTDRRQIAREYLRFWFWIDLLASFPFDIIFTSASTQPDEDVTSLSINKLFRMLRVFKLLRVLRLSRVMARLREYTKVNPSVLLLLKTIAIVFFVWHWAACSYWFVAATEHDYGENFCDNSLREAENDAGCNRWFDKALLEEDSISRKYSYSWFMAIVATTGVGWDIVPSTPVEVIFTTFMIVVGVMMSVLIVGSVTSAISALNSAHLEKRRKMEQIFSYLRSRMVPAELQNKIRGYFEFLWSHDIEKEPLRLDMLPDSLQIEVAIEVNKNLIDKVPLFRGLSPPATFDLISNLNRKVYLPEDEIIQEGDDYIHELYLLVRGRVRVLMGELQVAELKEGSFFGEAALLTDQPRNASVVAMEYCDVLILAREDLQNCIDTHPELRASIELEAQKRTRALNLWKKVARAAGWSGAAHMRVMLAHAIRAAAAAGDGGGGGGGGNSAERGSTDTLGSVPEGGGGGEMMDVVRKLLNAEGMSVDNAEMIDAEPTELAELDDENADADDAADERRA